VVLVLSPVHQVSDAAYSLLVSECLIRHQTPVVDRYVQTPLDPAIHPGTENGELPYQLFRSGGHVHYTYPPGTPVLSVPFVVLSHPFGMTAVSEAGEYDAMEERRMQFRLAALLMACFGSLTYLTARALLSDRWSLLVTAAVVFTTQVWSTASRGLWSHTWAILLVLIAVWLIVRNELEDRPLRPVVQATVLCWAFFTRPTMIVGLVIVGVYLAIRHRGAVVAYAATAACWLTAFAATSWWQFGRLLPPYYSPGKLGTPDFWEGLSGNLVSPSRGLLVFLPHLVIVIYWLIRYGRRSGHTALAVLGAIGALGHLLIVASFPMWWGGHGYGPRLMTDALPWLVLVALVSVRAWVGADPAPSRTNPRRFILEAAAAVALTLAALIIHGAGALSESTNAWNWTPVNVDQQPSRVWDWRDPQFLSPFLR
jgi:hypothetical protein